MSKRGARLQERYEDRRVIDPNRTWFVAATYAAFDVWDEVAQDAAAAEELRRVGLDVWMPRYWTIEARRGKRTDVERLFFPGYLFVGASTRDASPIQRSRQVHDVLGVDEPMVLPHLLIQVLADRLTGNERSDKLRAAALFRVLEMRYVVKGPFAGFLAQVSELLSNGRVKADVAVFGRPTSVEFDPDFLGTA